MGSLLNIVNRSLLLAFILASISNAQTFTIPGIDGIEFDSTGGDYSVTITDAFTIFGISASPTSITLSYQEDADTFTMQGGASVTIDGFEVTGNIDLVLMSGTIDALNIDVEESMEFKSLSFNNTNESGSFGFSWASEDSTFQLKGSATTTIDGNELSVSFGELGDPDSNPGLILQNGVITQLQVSVSADFDLKAISIAPEDLTFKYEADTDLFEMFGSATTTIDENEVSISIGDDENPGIVLDNGTLTNINFGVTADFDMKGITISPDALTFQYDEANTQYEMFGSVSVKFDGEEIDANMGDEENPGLVFKNNVVTHVNFGLTAEFGVKGLSVSPTDLTFQYDADGDHFEMFGSISFKIGSDEVEAIMGDVDDPGLIYKNNSIQQVNIGITTDFEVSGLKIKTNDLGAEWHSNNDYNIYGDADLSINSENIDADFGTFSDPGIVIRNGNLHSFEVDLNSDIKLGNLEVETKDLDVKYQNSKFEVTGEMAITEVFSLDVTLGEGDQAGLEIDVSGSEPRFKVEALEIDIEHANLGAIDLKKFDLKFNSSGIEESAVKVVFPQGWEIDADLKFTGNPAKLNSIEIDYRADNLAEAIEMFEGVQIAFLGASVDNLTKPSELKVTGTIETIYGGGFTLDGKSATLLEMRDEVTIEPDYFEVKGDVNVGAYRTGEDHWRSLIGSGDITLQIGTIENYHPFPKSFCEMLPADDNFCYTTDWSGVKAHASVKIPGDPLIEADATVALDNHKNFDALLDVEFIVPHWVPIIGGKHYGSVDGAIRYKHRDLNHSYGAGWVRIKTFWHTYHTGAKYEFGSRKVKSIGSGTISSIQKEINSDLNKSIVSSDAPKSIVHTFEVDETNPDLVLIEVDWVDEVDSTLITVTGPEGLYELTKVVVVAQNDTATTPTLSYEENMDVVVGDSVATFLLTTPSAFTEDSTIKKPSLIDGRYQLIISYFDELTDIDTVVVHPMWQAPEAELSVSRNDGNGFELELDYWSSLPDSTILSLYVTSSEDFTDERLLDHVYASNFDENGYGTEMLDLNPDFILANDTLYFFGVIEDGFNPPFRTEISPPFIYQPDISGILEFPAEADSLKSGLRVFIDEDVDGSFDTESTGGLELFGITDEDGQFAISGLSNSNTYELRIVLPEGYRIVGEADRFGSEIFTFEGDPQTFALEIEAYIEETE